MSEEPRTPNSGTRRKYLSLAGLSITGLAGCSFLPYGKYRPVSADQRCEETTAEPTTTVSDSDSAHSKGITQWGVFEASFTNRGTYTDSEKYTTVDLNVVFNGPNGESTVVPGFWDGGDTFRIRFSPPSAGSWSFTTRSNEPSLDGNSGRFKVLPPGQSQIDSNPNYRGLIQPTDDGRYLEYADGTPFLYVAGTAWDIALMSKDSEWPTYVDDRKCKDFTVLQVAWTPWHDKKEVNEAGYWFHSNYDELNINAHQIAEQKIQYAYERGMHLFIQPMWGDAWKYASGQQIKWWQRHILARYQPYAQFISISGEYGYSACCSQQNSLGKLINDLDGLNHATGIHPGPLDEAASPSSLADFKGKAWLDFHQHQTHGRYDEFELLKQDYREADKPLLNTEAGYDGEFGQDRSDVRRDMYEIMFSGLAAGYTYGVDGTAHDYSGLENLNARSSWDVQRMVGIINAEMGGPAGWQNLTNDQSMIVSAKGKPIATYLPDGSRVFVYLAKAKDAEIDLFRIDSMKAELTLFNTASGSTRTMGTFSTSDTVTVTGPSWEDALLICRSEK